MTRLDYDALLHDGIDEFRRFCNPMIAQRASLAAEPVRVVGTRDGVLVDAAGELVEDLHGFQALGHRNPEVSAALLDYLQTDHPSWFPSRVSPFMGRLGRRLSERTGFEISWFGCTGSDVVEAAMKLARAATGRPRILSLTGAYHGCTFGSCALMEEGPFRDPFGPHLPGVGALPFADVAALEAALVVGDVAAVVVEPIQGEGGVRPLPPAYVDALCELTRAHGTLLVADEVQTGLGRTGRGFLRSCPAWPRRPEVVLLAKALGGGIVPISAMLTSEALFRQAYGRDVATAEAHNTTFSVNALGAVAALTTLELVDDSRIARIAQAGEHFERALSDALAGSPLFVEVRGEGLMRGIRLEDGDHPWLSFEHFGYPDLADHSVIAPLLCHRIYRHGFYAFACGHDWSVVRAQPRYDIPLERLDRFAAVCRLELDRLAEVVT